jgi:hypothetical protein
VIIILLCWAAVIAILLIAVLALARAESYSDALSSHIPDGFEWHQRRIREAEKKRGTNRVVAPGLAIAPAVHVRPGSTADPASSYWQGASQPVIATSHNVVEVHAFGRPTPLEPERTGGQTGEADVQRTPSALRTRTQRTAAARFTTAAPAQRATVSTPLPAPHPRVTVRTSPAVVPAWIPSPHPDRRTTEEKAQSPALANLVSKTEKESARRDLQKNSGENTTEER